MATSPDDESTAVVERPFSAKVEAMAGYGVPDVEIATVLAIDVAELRSVYRRELETGSTKTNLCVAESLFRKATGEGREAVTAAIFWLKTRAKWKETSVHEVAVDPHRIDYSNWSDEKLEAEIRKLDSSMASMRGQRPSDLL